MTNLASTCCLCDQVAGRSDGDLISQLLVEASYVRRVVIETKGFAVVPSLGAIVPGHVLLCPKKHVRSYAQLFSRNGTGPNWRNLIDEFFAIKAELTKVLQDVYEAPVHCFEHGSAHHSSQTICTVDHAHLHLLPANVNIVSMLLQDDMWKEASCNVIDLGKHVGTREYLYYQSPERLVLVAANHTSYQSQYMRRIFADAVGNSEDWNWRANPRPELADRIYVSISRATGQRGCRSHVRDLRCFG
jgi:diadenosine tetraphosphate (Ap4A) HIT family hydrolase